MPVNMLYARTRADVLAALEALKGEGVLPADLNLANVALEAPRDAAHGDVATNAAMVLAKPAGMNPRALAEALLPKLKALDYIAAVDVAGPGFINMFYADAALRGEVAVIETAGSAYGSVDLARGVKAMVEYVSINPTGPIHVGHGRNAVFGDATANLLDKTGYNVWREYLLNDAGGQIRVLVRSLHARYLQLFGVDVQVPADGYPGEYLIEIAEALKAKDGDKWLHVTDEKELLQGLRFFAVEKCLDMIKADLVTLGIEFDRYFSEYAMHQTSAMTDAVAYLREKGYVYEGTLPPPKGKEIADYVPVELTLFKATAFGLADDQPIYKRNGEPTYFGQDLGYHYDKVRRGFGLLVNVLGIDQAGSFKPLEKAVEAMTGTAGIFHPLPYEMVKVLRDGQPVKLSKRAGNIVLLSDVLSEVGTDAFRFTMLTVKPTTILVFDLAKAVQKNMENPVFYVQYAHARLCTVQRTVAGMDEFKGIKAGGLAVTAPVRAVLNKLVFYPAVIEQAARSLEPHRLAVYAQELAAAVHSWYGAEKFIDAADPAGTLARMDLIRAAQTVLADVLRLCGVDAPESM